MPDFRDLLNVGRAAASGYVGYQQANQEQEAERRRRQQEDVDRAEQTRLRALEAMLADERLQEIRNPRKPTPTYDLDADGDITGSGFTDPAEAARVRDKYGRPQESPEPRTPVVRELPDGRPVQWNYATSQWEPMRVGGQEVKAPAPGAGGNTMSERQNARLGIVASRANAELNQLDQHLTGIPEAALVGGGATTGIFSGLKNAALAKMAGGDGQMAVTAGLNFINPVVRYLSGAQMNEGEAARYQRALLPQPGEDEQTRVMKRRMRDIIVEAMGTGQWQAPESDTPDIANLEMALAEAQAIAEREANSFGPLAGGYRSSYRPENPYR